MAKAAVLLTDGLEEIETVTVVDVLRRGGVEVTTFSLGEPVVQGSHGMGLTADDTFSNLNVGEFDALILPGGQPASNNLAENSEVLSAIKDAAGANKVLAAICAAPLALEKAGVLAEKEVTAHPSVHEQLVSANVTQARITKDGNFITGRAAGSALAFAYLILETLTDAQTVQKVEEGVLSGLLTPDEEKAHGAGFSPGEGLDY